jgi:hypothetical protein
MKPTQEGHCRFIADSWVSLGLGPPSPAPNPAPPKHQLPSSNNQFTLMLLSGTPRSSGLGLAHRSVVTDWGTVTHKFMVLPVKIKIHKASPPAKHNVSPWVIELENIQLWTKKILPSYIAVPDHHEHLFSPLFLLERTSTSVPSLTSLLYAWSCQGSPSVF